MLLTILLPVFLLSFTLTGAWLVLARRFVMFDYPNHRSSHAQPTPKSGGSGFVVAFTLLTLALYFDRQLSLSQLLLFCSGLILAVTGLVDDIRSLGVVTRIGIQVFVAGLAAVFIDGMPDLVLPWGTLSEQWLLVPLFVVAMTWQVNLYNFMDGIDALAAVEAVFFCLALAFFASLRGSGLTSVLAPGLAVAVGGFLFFNMPPARLFMGDIGSNYLGYVLGVLAVVAIQESIVNIWTVLVLLGVFIADATTTLVARMGAGSVWYHAHRSHAYQQAAIRLGSHGRVVMLTGLVNLLWLLPLAVLANAQERWGLLVTMLAWLPLVGMVLYLRVARQ